MSMRVLITGSAGFVGRHLIDECRRAGHRPLGFDTQPTPALPEIDQLIGSITEPYDLSRAIERLRPDACIHLAGIAFVPRGWTDPQLVMNVNLNGTLNVLEAIRVQAPETRILVVTSAEVYGREERPEPVREEDGLTPSNLYGISKMAADLGTLLYHRQYDMHVMTARPQNHIGPGQSRLFVVTSFAEQLIALKNAASPDGSLKTGNLDSERDFTDVRDVVRAYRLLVEDGKPGQTYNIASGRMAPIRHMLEQLCQHANITPNIETDPNLYRPTDRPPKLCIEKITQDVGWTPAIPLDQTLRDIYDDLLHQRT